jgi:hypothetical protein
MKMIINTQIRENYGAHDWNGEGECPQYWKFKGGNTYVVRDLKESHVVKINMVGIPTLTSLIEERNEHFEEYILDYEIVEDSAKECEEWEAPIEFVWSGDRWLCLREKSAGEFDCWSDGITLKSESWIPLEGGERADYECKYYDSKGRMIDIYKEAA